MSSIVKEKFVKFKSFSKSSYEYSLTEKSTPANGTLKTLYSRPVKKRLKIFIIPTI